MNKHFMTMKKQYQQPSMTAVELQDICSIVMTSESAVDGPSLVRGIDSKFDDLWDGEDE